MRAVKYHFGPEFFDLQVIGTTLFFTVGEEKEVPNFRIIERLYFRDTLI
jgi:hypothetical protein